MRSFGDANEKYGKVFLIVASLVLGVLILAMFKVYGYDETWKLWRVPVEHPQFEDFRLIPGSAESFHMGFEPTQYNPGDPHKRIFNYPIFWRLFFYTGITQNDTYWIVPLMLVLFFVSVLLFPQGITMIDAIFILLIVFSPAPMLLYERGNVDLIVFFLCAMIVMAAEYSALITAALLIFATIVKLFPFFGVTVLLRESKSKFIWLLAGCFGVALAYVVVSFGSVKAAWNLTMRGSEISYGADVLFYRYNQYFAQHLGVSPNGRILSLGPILLAFLLFLICGIAGLARREPLTSPSSRNLTAFRMGASIYVGTFLLGNNWDYRLAFLILVMPQLLQWARINTLGYRWIATLTLVAVFASCWHFMIWYSPTFEPHREIVFVVDELTNWLLAALLSYLLTASTPEWLKAIAHHSFNTRKVIAV